MSGYDPTARRDTPLALKLKDAIRRRGPISVADYMAACLTDPDHGYYTGKSAIGAHGDFITAPEISQVFGELLGLWSVVVWKQMGAPASFNLIELGPGRATMMKDALRAAALAPDFLAAADICLIEINPALRAQQLAALRGDATQRNKPRWFERIEELQQHDAADKPAIIIANEFLDTYPPTQFVRQAPSWHWRYVGLDQDDNLQFCESTERTDSGSADLHQQLESMFPDARDGEVVSRTAFGAIPGVVLDWHTVAALFIDYGETTAIGGDTLQALRNQAYEHPLTSPGEADLSALVDFLELDRITEMVSEGRLAVDGPVPQAEFLGRLGIMERASRLMAANTAKAAEIETGIARLMSPQGMGTRFKAIGIRSAGLPVLPGFA